MRVAVTGSTGLLVKHILEQQPTGTEILALARQQPTGKPLDIIQYVFVDLLDVHKVSEILESWKPDVIVHTAAEGSVDAVEGHLDIFRPLNVEVPRKIAAWCARNDSQFVFVSSNAVYKGKDGAYDDDDPVDPVNDYGRLKVEAESAVLSELPSSFLPRSILMYGWPSPAGLQNPILGGIVFP